MTVSHQILFEGDSANLRLLIDDIRNETDLSNKLSFSLSPSDRKTPHLNNGDWSQLAIDFAVGISTSVLYDTVKACVAKARRRGPINEVDTDEPGSGGTPPEVE